MALSTFETDNAKYHLGLGNHGFSSEKIFKNVNFSDLDCFVFEFGNNEKLIKNGLHNSQYKGLFNKILNENPNLEVYNVDTYIPNSTTILSGVLFDAVGLVAVASVGKNLIEKRKRTELNRRDFLKSLGLFAGASFFGSSILDFPNSFSGDIKIPLISNFQSLKTNLLPTPLLGFRDAITAKKVSEYLVPKYEKKGRKPNVALIYGGAHSGIETKLKHPWIYEKTLEMYQDKFGIGDKEVLNKVMKIIREDDELKIENENCNLF